jgi:hypothetical protein
MVVPAGFTTVFRIGFAIQSRFAATDKVVVETTHTSDLSVPPHYRANQG